MKCGMCGYEFSEKMECRACVGQSCGECRCPACGYSTPPPSKIALFLKKIRGSKNVKQ
jgi:hypothetical protein